jgi:hypothetical protein
VAAMRETIEQCSCHLGIPEHAGPFAEVRTASQVRLSSR